MKKIVIPIIFVLVTSFGLHKYYVSVTEMNYDSNSGKIEIIMRVFPNDIENVLHDTYEIDADLTKRETKNFLYRYINKSFHIWSGEEEIAYNILGTSEEYDFLIILIEAKTASDLHDLIVKNTVLQDLFDEQKNLLHFKSGDKKQSFILEKGNPETEITF